MPQTDEEIVKDAMSKIDKMNHTDPKDPGRGKAEKEASDAVNNLTDKQRKLLAEKLQALIDAMTQFLNGLNALNSRRAETPRPR